MEQSCSHFIPGLFGSLISTILISLGLFIFDWRMALAALWVHSGILRHRVLCSYKVQDRVQTKDDGRQNGLRRRHSGVH